MASGVDSKMELRIEKDESYRRELMLLFKDLRSMAISGMEYFQEEKRQNNERFHTAFNALYDHLERGIEPAVDYLTRIAHTFDYSPDHPGNGYRSIVKVTHKCALHILQLCRYVTLNRDSFLFRGGHYSRELEAYVSTLGQLRACLFYLQKLSSYCTDGDLCPDEDNLNPEDYKTAEQLMIEVENLSQETFYGRCLAFQYCQSMQKPLTTINLVMASFSEGYNHSSTVMKFANSIIGGSKYVVDPERRAQQVVDVTRNGDIKFCKAFWQINENSLMHTLPLFVCPPVHLDKVISLPPVEFELPLVDGSDTAKITVPCAHSGPAPVNTRLISYELREGQEKWRGIETGSKTQSPHLAPKSQGLVIHIHGGGFVAQSSASHEVYLRYWAKELGVPIFCVDYSLAPEHPFPRQLEEAFYAYCWALKNAHLLGSTGERICIAGDSAGGNLAVAIAIRALSFGIRPPDGILSTYGCMLVKYTPSPSRILALMDPLLPIGILSKCLAAYAGIQTDGPEGTFQFPHSASTSSFGSALESGYEEGLANCQTPGSKDSGSGNIEEEKETEDSPEAGNTTGRFIRHKQTGSGDSGFQECFIDESEGRISSVDSEDLAGVHRDTTKFTLPEEDEAEDNTEDKGFNDSETTSPNTSPNKDSKKIVELVDQIKEGADKVDTDATSSQAQRKSTTPNRSMMKLDFGNMLRPLRRSTSLSKSPSSPTFSTFQHQHSRSYSADLKHAPITPPPKSPFGSPPLYANTRHFAQSPMQQFHHMPISKNPYMSPLLASDEQLKGLPPVYLVACQLDPILDDSIMFARRLKSLDLPVHLDILDDLPHGFLNFVLISPEAKKASELCVARIREILDLDGIEELLLDDLDLDPAPDPNDDQWELLEDNADELS